MNRIHITKSACAIAAGILVAAGLSTAGAQTLIFGDNFAGAAATTVDSANTGDITGVDSGAGGALPKAINQEQTLDGSGNLLFPSAPGTRSNMIGFGTVGAPSTDYDFSAGAGGADIIAAGGMTVSFTWSPNDTTDGNWLFFAVGSTSVNQNYYFNYGNPLFNTGASEIADAVLLQNNGVIQSYYGSNAAATGSFTPAGSLTDTISLTYDFTSWAPGSPVSVVADVNGAQVLTDSFSWNNNQSGANYFTLGTFQESNAISNLQINTLAAAVPEPGAFGMAFLGLGSLLIWRRVRGSRGALV